MLIYSELVVPQLGGASESLKGFFRSLIGISLDQNPGVDPTNLFSGIFCCCFTFYFELVSVLAAVGYSSLRLLTQLPQC